MVSSNIIYLTQMHGRLIIPPNMGNPCGILKLLLLLLLSQPMMTILVWGSMPSHSLISIWTQNQQSRLHYETRLLMTSSSNASIHSLVCWVALLPALTDRYILLKKTKIWLIKNKRSKWYILSCETYDWAQQICFLERRL